MVNAAAAYRNAELEGISQRDLIIKLYLGAERFLREAAVAMREVRPSDAHDGCVKAKTIFVELLSTLNFDQGGDIAQRLRALYVFLINGIAEANLRKDAAKVEALMPIVVTLRSAWEQIPAEHANTSALPAGEHRHSLDLKT